ncbi:hypothetical protein ACFV3N_16815 [Streptomyces bauhiniae]|uniref:hypothetical protein n=1 Tax=Streptomyces bauhiniae TaxID=2340725 RepID=UPI003665B21C
MTTYKIESPVRSFTGESAGVHFNKGTGYVDDSTKEGRGAVEYFRRHGYGVAPADEVTEEERVQELVTGTTGDGITSPTEALINLGHGSAPSVGFGMGVQTEPIIPAAPEYDPARHNQDDVLAYLDSLVGKDSDSDAEFARVIAAEREGKKRKAILARGEQNPEAGK